MPFFTFNKQLPFKSNLLISLSQRSALRDEFKTEESAESAFYNE
jgi:hypothetical protein